MPLLNVLSDLHLELEPFSPGQTDADVVVLAGDVHTGTRGIDWAKETYTGKPVVYVLGNHEYYGKAIPKHTDTLRDRAKGSNVHVLENESITVGDTVACGPDPKPLPRLKVDEPTIGITITINTVA